MNKQYNVRVINKIDSLENWMNSTLILQNGEIAIAEYTLADNTKGCIIKIGNGVDVFKDLKIPEDYNPGKGIEINKTDNNTLSSISVICPIQPITQEEYNNLTAEEKMAEVVYLITDAGGSSGSGIADDAILIWHDPANIPEGWTICNGNYGSPDLQGKFIVGGKNLETFYGLKESTATGSTDSAVLSFNSVDMTEIETVGVVFIMQIPKDWEGGA